jgi:hypothetical protein
MGGHLLVEPEARHQQRVDDDVRPGAKQAGTHAADHQDCGKHHPVSRIARHQQLPIAAVFARRIRERKRQNQAEEQRLDDINGNGLEQVHTQDEAQEAQGNEPQHRRISWQVMPLPGQDPDARAGHADGLDHQAEIPSHPAINVEEHTERREGHRAAAFRREASNEGADHHDRRIVPVLYKERDRVKRREQRYPHDHHAAVPGPEDPTFEKHALSPTGRDRISRTRRIYACSADNRKMRERRSILEQEAKRVAATRHNSNVPTCERYQNRFVGSIMRSLKCELSPAANSTRTSARPSDSPRKSRFS